MDKEIKCNSGINENKIFQICDIDKKYDEQVLFVNLSKIISISFIYSGYKEDEYGWSVPEYYNPPKVKIYIEGDIKMTISYEEFEKYLKPYIENLNC